MKKKTRFTHSHADHHLHDGKHSRKLTRKQKNVFHWLLIVFLLVSLVHEGAQIADWLFLALAVAVEVS